MGIGDRMKRYEAATRYVLTPRTYTVIRVDGKNFHAFTRDCERPYDYTLMDTFEYVSRNLLEHIPGSLLAYHQSDEISIILQDFKRHNTVAWMGGIVQKQASIASSLTTAYFNENYAGSSLACFDARTYTIPSLSEVKNYLIWRQQDTTRNSINMAASSVFSHKQLHGLTSGQRQEKLFSEADINWNDYPTRAKRGSCSVRRQTKEPLSYTDKRTGQEVTLPQQTRSIIATYDEIPIFTSYEGGAFLDKYLYVEEEV